MLYFVHRCRQPNLNPHPNSLLIFTPRLTTLEIDDRYTAFDACREPPIVASHFGR